MRKTTLDIGATFGKLTVLSNPEYTIKGRSVVICKCDCGKIKQFYIDKVKSGRSKSCGCIPSQTKHKQSRTKLYSVWGNMNQRCVNPRCHAYKNYGARGIRVCIEWQKDYTQFLVWAQTNGYEEGLQLDRYPNNDGNYEPSNCRFVTPENNLANRRNTVLIEYQSQTKSLSQWSRILGFKYSYVHNLLSKGITFSEAIIKATSKSTLVH